MRSANEVTFVDTMYRTYSHALSAACAERVIYSGEVVYNLDCTVGTDLFALHTADTAV